MKRIFARTAAIAGLAAMSMSLIACGNKADTASEAVTSAPVEQLSEEEYAPYNEVIAEVSDMILNGGDASGMGDRYSALFEIVKDHPAIGYARVDIDGNGVEELVLGETSNEVSGCAIYDMYTIKDGQLVHVLSSDMENVYMYCSDSQGNVLSQEGTTGGGDSYWAYYRFQGAELTLIESVIYDPEFNHDQPWFYSQEAAYDPDHTKSITEDEAFETTLKYDYIYIEYTLFGGEDAGQVTEDLSAVAE